MRNDELDVFTRFFFCFFFFPTEEIYFLNRSLKSVLTAVTEHLVETVHRFGTYHNRPDTPASAAYTGTSGKNGKLLGWGRAKVFDLRTLRRTFIVHIDYSILL